MTMTKTMNVTMTTVTITMKDHIVYMTANIITTTKDKGTTSFAVLHNDKRTTSFVVD